MVLNVVSRKEKLDFRDSELVLLPQFPIFGVSPDGICEGSCMYEIKCPAKESTVIKYIQNGKIAKKCKAQMQLQMLVTNTRKGYFCVADLNFEETKNIVILTEHFDENFVMDIIEKAT